MILLGPVFTVDLFPEERGALLDLLASLSEGQWEAMTVCPGWTAGDIARHVLADDLGRLSRGRDGYRAGSFRASGREALESELLEFVNQQNELWVSATRRLGPRVVIDLLRLSGEQTQAYFESLDMFAIGAPVTWAGPERAPVWLDIAREYTERWLHQAQIRDAVGAEPLVAPRLFYPVLDTFARALPHTYRSVFAPEGTHVRMTISDAEGMQWSLVREEAGWGLYRDVASVPDAEVKMEGDTAWRLFTKGMAMAKAVSLSTISGDRALAGKLFETVAIIA